MSTADDFYCRELIPGRFAVTTLHESAEVLAFEHTDPYWEVHWVVIPKRHIESLAAIDASTQAIAHELMDVAASLCARLTARFGGCTMVTGCGSDQKSAHLHLIVHAGRRLRHDDGSRVAP